MLRKIFVIMRALLEGEASIESVRKSAISKSPGDVTDIAHN